MSEKNTKSEKPEFTPETVATHQHNVLQAIEAVVMGWLKEESEAGNRVTTNNMGALQGKLAQVYQQAEAGLNAILPEKKQEKPGVKKNVD